MTTEPCSSNLGGGRFFDALYATREGHVVSVQGGVAVIWSLVEAEKVVRQFALAFIRRLRRGHRCEDTEEYVLALEIVCQQARHFKRERQSTAPGASGVQGA